jgi:hypothetical protein
LLRQFGEWLKNAFGGEWPTFRHPEQSRRIPMRTI